MKACKECRWFVRTLWNLRLPECSQPDVMDSEEDYVNGRVRRELVHVERARRSPGLCRSEAVYWEPRPHPQTWLQGLFGRRRG